MTKRDYVAVGLGEVLWDLLPAGKQLGGAPANFAYMSHLLGARGMVASRVGGDASGDELRGRLAGLGLEAEIVQVDTAHETGKVEVRLDSRGQPSYEIAQGVAWDFLELTARWQRLAAEADVICFGSLAQRAPVSRATIRAFLAGSRRDSIRIFDVNLRQQFYTREVLAESLRLANVAKLNAEELPVVTRELGLDQVDEKASARALLRKFQLAAVCVTRGGHGSLLLHGEEMDEHPGFAVRVVDLVGAGDAFTAALAHHLARGSSLKVANAAANRMGAWVASEPGATPAGNAEVIREVRVASDKVRKE